MRYPGFIGVAVLLLAGGCVPAYQPLAPLGPGEVAALEARLAQDTTDQAALVSLGAAYRGAGRLEEARTLLERALELRPGDPDAILHLGITYEELERYAEARAYYQHYLEAGTSPRLKSLLAARLRLVEREELRAAVREALRIEGELATVAPQPRTVAVFPFLFVATNPELEPLSRALAEFLVTDLGQTDRLTVLERARVQMLLDEMALADAGIVEPGTAARGGRLLGAGQVVQGRIAGGEERLGLEAMVVTVESGGAGRIVPVREEDRLEALFEMEKRLALGIYQSLGIELTVAERERISRRPTENLRAALEYGLGLIAADEGRFGDAAGHFLAAAQLDPEFEAARERAEATSAAAGAAEVSTGELAAFAVESMPLDPAVETPVAAGVDFASLDALLPGFSGRNPVAEILGQENFGGPPVAGGTFLRIILKLRHVD